MWPVNRWTIVEGERLLAVLDQAIGRLGLFPLKGAREPNKRLVRRRSPVRLPDLVQHRHCGAQHLSHTPTSSPALLTPVPRKVSAYFANAPMSLRLCPADFHAQRVQTLGAFLYVLHYSALGFGRLLSWRNHAVRPRSSLMTDAGSTSTANSVFPATHPCASRLPKSMPPASVALITPPMEEIPFPRRPCPGRGVETCMVSNRSSQSVNRTNSQKSVRFGNHRTLYYREDSTVLSERSRALGSKQHGL